MIKFHYHKIPKAVKVGKLTLQAGTVCCHVYSDLLGKEGRDELLAWGCQRGFIPRWLHRPPGGPVHYDAFKSMLRFCGPGVSDEVFVSDKRRISDESTEGAQAMCEDGP